MAIKKLQRRCKDGKESVRDVMKLCHELLFDGQHIKINDLEKRDIVRLMDVVMELRLKRQKLVDVLNENERLQSKHFDFIHALEECQYSMKTLGIVSSDIDVDDIPFGTAKMNAYMKALNGRVLGKFGKAFGRLGRDCGSKQQECR